MATATCNILMYIVPTSTKKWWYSRARTRTPNRTGYTKTRDNRGSGRNHRIRHEKWIRRRRTYAMLAIATSQLGLTTGKQVKPIPRISEGGTKDELRTDVDEKGEDTAPEIIVISNHTTIVDAMDTDAARRTSPFAIQFDTDSVPIKVDNCCTRTMSFCKDDFVQSSLVPIKNKVVKSYSGALTPITHEGTIQWWVTDDDGAARMITVPGAYLVPEGTTRLLSPQHWAQQVDDNTPIKRGTWCATYEDEVTLQWQQRKYQKTIKLDPHATNVATMWTAPGFHKFDEFLIEEETNEAMAMVFASEIIEDEIVLPEEITPEPRIEGEDDDGAPMEYADDYNEPLNGPSRNKREEDAPEIPEMPTSQYDNQSLDPIYPTETQQELIHWHNKLGHISMRRIQKMAAQGMLPSRLARCEIPMCQACLYGMMKRKPWKTNETKSHVLFPVTKPGDCVSVDQLESPIPGLIAQLKGTPTRSRYRVATIFVDHYSDLSYVHFQQSTNADETLRAKHEFERYATTHNVTITHYHADNGRFAELTWTEDAMRKGQRVSYSGVGAHHQNGRAEKRIQDLQNLTRSALLHANKRWPSAIDARLWPYAMRKSNGNMNDSPHPTKVKTPLQLFLGVDMSPSTRDEHPFGCPMYVLDSRAQGGFKPAKWASRARLAIYLGPSVHHSKNVGLALSTTTGLVSPQFHARYDDRFGTINELVNGSHTKSMWQTRCGFIDDPNPPTTIDSEVGILPPNIPNEPNKTIESTTSPEGAGVPEQQPMAEPTQTENVEKITTTRSGRTVRPPSRYDDYVSFETLMENMDDTTWDNNNPIQAMATSSDPDVLYLHEALQQPDKHEFLKAMKKEIQAQTDNGNWVIVERNKVPKQHKVLPAVWAMRRKRRISTGEVYKWKARLNIDGGKQEKGVNYWETYAPVATWSSIRLIMSLAARKGWATKQLD